MGIDAVRVVSVPDFGSEPGCDDLGSTYAHP